MVFETVVKSLCFYYTFSTRVIWEPSGSLGAPLGHSWPLLLTLCCPALLLLPPLGPQTSLCASLRPPFFPSTSCPHRFPLGAAVSRSAYNPPPPSGMALVNTILTSYITRVFLYGGPRHRRTTAAVPRHRCTISPSATQSATWNTPGPLWAALGRLWAPLGRLLVVLACYIGSSWATLGAHWLLLGALRCSLVSHGRSWGVFRSLLVALLAFLNANWAAFGHCSDQHL